MCKNPPVPNFFPISAQGLLSVILAFELNKSFPSSTTPSVHNKKYALPIRFDFQPCP